MIAKAGLVALFVVAVYLMIATGSGAGDSMNDQPEPVTCEELKSVAARAALDGSSLDGYTELMRRYC